METKINLHPESSSLVFFSAIALFISFFLPWASIFGMSISGYEIGKLGSEGNYAWIIPILSGATIFVSLSGSKNRTLGLICGIIPLLAILYLFIEIGQHAGFRGVGEVLKNFFKIFSIGVWLTIISSVAMIYGALDNNLKIHIES